MERVEGILTMKRSGKNNGRTEALQKPAPETGDSGTVALEKSRERVLDEIIDRLPAITGIADFDVAIRIVEQIGCGLVCPRPKDTHSSIVSTARTIAAMGPQNLTEAMLSAQMIAVNDAVHLFLARATAPNQGTEAIDLNVLRATRLMRVFTEQLEAMQKLKGKVGQQKVTVEHVHVHQGGQAIVGAVAAEGPGPGVGDGKEKR
ncbi:MAG: hypothetical protein ABSH49_02870 [Bryobacteraceae bacterium]